MNLENKENLSNYQLLKRKPSLCSTSLPFSKLITVVQFFFSPDTDSGMVSIKFWRRKFSRPATGYECIAHALAFDRGVFNHGPCLSQTEHASAWIPFARIFLHECFHVTFANFISSHPRYYKYAFFNLFIRQ